MWFGVDDVRACNIRQWSTMHNDDVGVAEVLTYTVNFLHQRGVDESLVN